MMNDFYTLHFTLNGKKSAYVKKTGAGRARRVGFFTRVFIILGIAAFLFGLTEALISGAQLRSARYKDAVRQYHIYSDLHYEYQMVDLAIAQMQIEAKAEDARTRAFWREERKRNEESWNSQWEDFDLLVAYYGQSAGMCDVLNEQTEEYSIISSRFSDVATSIENEAEERSYVGTAFMGMGGALLAVGIIKLLRELQLLGRFSRMTKYCA